jgi:flagellar biosynthesis component FlhA
MVTMNILAIVVAFAACFPSAIIAFAFWVMEKKIEKRDKQEDERMQANKMLTDEREKRRQDSEFMTLQCVHASLALSEATAKAVKRIPEAHCNGDMDEALKYADNVKHQQKDFIERAGIDNIYNNEQNYK